MKKYESYSCHTDFKNESHKYAFLRKYFDNILTISSAPKNRDNYISSELLLKVNISNNIEIAIIECAHCFNKKYKVKYYEFCCLDLTEYEESNYSKDNYLFEYESFDCLKKALERLHQFHIDEFESLF